MKLHSKLLSRPLSEGNYDRKLELLLHCEEHQLQFDIHHYDMVGEPMVRRGHLMELRVPGLAENRPSVLKGDKLIVRQHGAGGEEEYEGVVHEVTITLQSVEGGHKEWGKTR